jgi:hypothetical protein
MADYVKSPPSDPTDTRPDDAETLDVPEGTDGLFEQFLYLYGILASAAQVPDKPPKKLTGSSSAEDFQAATTFFEESTFGSCPTDTIENAIDLSQFLNVKDVPGKVAERAHLLEDLVTAAKGSPCGDNNFTEAGFETQVHESMKKAAKKVSEYQLQGDAVKPIGWLEIWFYNPDAEDFKTLVELISSTSTGDNSFGHALLDQPYGKRLKEAAVKAWATRHFLRLREFAGSRWEVAQKYGSDALSNLQQIGAGSGILSQPGSVRTVPRSKLLALPKTVSDYKLVIGGTKVYFQDPVQEAFESPEKFGIVGYTEWTQESANKAALKTVRGKVVKWAEATDSETQSNLVKDIGNIVRTLKIPNVAPEVLLPQLMSPEDVPGTPDNESIEKYVNNYKGARKYDDFPNKIMYEMATWESETGVPLGFAKEIIREFQNKRRENNPSASLHAPFMSREDADAFLEAAERVKRLKPASSLTKGPEVDAYCDAVVRLQFTGMSLFLATADIPRESPLQAEIREKVQKLLFEDLNENDTSLNKTGKIRIQDNTAEVITDTDTLTPTRALDYLVSEIGKIRNELSSTGVESYWKPHIEAAVDPGEEGENWKKANPLVHNSGDAAFAEGAARSPVWNSAGSPGAAGSGTSGPKWKRTQVSSLYFYELDKNENAAKRFQATFEATMGNGVSMCLNETETRLFTDSSGINLTNFKAACVAETSELQSTAQPPTAGRPGPADFTLGTLVRSVPVLPGTTLMTHVFMMYAGGPITSVVSAGTLFTAIGGAPGVSSEPLTFEDECRRVRDLVAEHWSNNDYTALVASGLVLVDGFLVGVKPGPWMKFFASGSVFVHACNQGNYNYVFIFALVCLLRYISKLLAPRVKGKRGLPGLNAAQIDLDRNEVASVSDYLPGVMTAVSVALEIAASIPDFNVFVEALTGTLNYRILAYGGGLFSLYQSSKPLVSYITARYRETKCCGIIASAVFEICKPNEQRGCIQSLNNMTYSGPSVGRSMSPYTIASALFPADTGKNEVIIKVLSDATKLADTQLVGTQLVVFANGDPAVLRFSEENTNAREVFERKLNALQGQNIMRDSNMRRIGGGWWEQIKKTIPALVGWFGIPTGSLSTGTIIAFIFQAYSAYKAVTTADSFFNSLFQRVPNFLSLAVVIMFRARGFEYYATSFRVDLDDFAAPKTIASAKNIGEAATIKFYAFPRVFEAKDLKFDPNGVFIISNNMAELTRASTVEDTENEVKTHSNVIIVSKEDETGGQYITPENLEDPLNKWLIANGKSHREALAKNKIKKFNVQINENMVKSGMLKAVLDKVETLVYDYLSRNPLPPATPPS